MVTVLPIDGASAAQTRTVSGGSLYALKCLGNHNVQLGTVNAETGELTPIGEVTPKSFLNSNTCIKMLTYDSSANTGFGYLASIDYAADPAITKIHSLNFATGVISSGINVVYPVAAVAFGFAVDPTSHKYYLLYDSYVDFIDWVSNGIHIAEVDPSTGYLTNDQVIADSDSDFGKGAAAGFVTVGFSYNTLKSKFYITTGNSAGGLKNNGFYHLYSYDPATRAFSDVATQPSIESATDGITPHSFFTMAFDSSGIMWGIATSSTKLVTQSATIDNWETPSDLKLSNLLTIPQYNYALAFAPPIQAPAFSLSSTSEIGTAGTAISGYSFSSTGGGIASYSISPDISNGLSFSTLTGRITGSPSAAASAVTYTITASNATGSASANYSLTVNAGAATSAATSEAQAKAAAAVAAAKREAEVKTARADISKALEKADNLTADSFAKADIAGVTKENIAEVQAEILALPAELRTDINQVLKVARKFEVVGKIASEQATTLPISAFVEVGLIPAESKNKVALIAAIRRASADSRDSFADIKAVIAAEAARIQDRKDRLAAAMNRLKSK
jgi:hypothetical protein